MSGVLLSVTGTEGAQRVLSVCLSARRVRSAVQAQLPRAGLTTSRVCSAVSVLLSASPSSCLSVCLAGWLPTQAMPPLDGVFVCACLSVRPATALFADLGHFNRPAIQLGFVCIVYPSILVTYLGQAAYLTRFPENVGYTYFKSLPGFTYWPMFVVATAAAIVASQALISASFQIVSQVWALRHLSVLTSARIWPSSKSCANCVFL
jgi:K+ transporter